MVDWSSQDTHLMLNPQWPLQDLQTLEKLVSRYPLAAHIWVASSGSSAAEISSVKVIALSKKALLASAAAVNRHLQSDSSDVWAQVLPDFHVGGLGIRARAFLSKAKVVQALFDGAWNADYFLKALGEKQITLTALVPTQVYDLIQTGQKPPASLRAVVVGGAALSQEIYEQAIESGWPLLPSFGMTECCSQIATASLDGWKKGERNLFLLSHVEARLDLQGFLQIRSPSLLSGYAQMIDGHPRWQDPKQDLWYLTEDKALLHGREVEPLGRGSDYVKVSGEGVDLRVLQEKMESLIRHRFPKLVSEIVLLAIPDSRRGHDIVAAVSTQVSTADLIQIGNEFAVKVAPYEKPSHFVQVNEIPRAALGKVEKEKLKVCILAELKRKLE